MRELSDEKLKHQLDKIYKHLIKLKRLGIETEPLPAKAVFPVW